MLQVSSEIQHDRLSIASQEELLNSHDPERFLNVDDIQFRQIIKMFEDLNLKQKKEFVSKFIKT